MLSSLLSEQKAEGGLFYDLAPSPHIPQPVPPQYGPFLDPREFVRQRAKYYACSDKLVRGPIRTRRLTDIRMAIARELRAMDFSTPEIARAMGRRNHTSILSLLKGGKRKCSSAK